METFFEAFDAFDGPGCLYLKLFCGHGGFSVFDPLDQSGREGAASVRQELGCRLRRVIAIACSPALIVLTIAGMGQLGSGS
ncbi:hypothetical protein BRAS3843_2630004 [Bradyrhizobium sp. STM 3843]|nr:hypothetical protein BRAS3843_2630004 [Bradyrhizobium sp. STM 3843]